MARTVTRGSARGLKPEDALRNKELWAKQILFWRTHLDCFIVDYLGVKLKDTQRVVARAFGNSANLDIVKSRGYGKTWLTAICCIAMAILYPGSLIAVASRTAEQATLVLKKIDDIFSKNPAILAEIECNNHRPVQINRQKGICRFLNGSKIESYSIGTMRGQRAKILVIDEAPEVKENDYNAVIGPVRNERRQCYYNYGVPDYPSKAVNITSACLKSNYFYRHFCENYKAMAQGDKNYFACALDYTSAIRVGITDPEFFEAERKKMPDVEFAMEYGSMFVGEEANSIFPYALTETCRTLQDVEYTMPRNSAAYYVMSVDIATSDAKKADNTCVTVLKCIEHDNGTITKKLVYIRTYHGTRLDVLAKEIRKTYVRFQNITKIVFDTNALGDSLPEFLSEPWVDPTTGKEYPAWVRDDDGAVPSGAEPMLHAFRGNNTLNQEMVKALRVALEQKTLELPVNSRLAGLVQEDPDDPESIVRKQMDMEVQAIYIEADALQIEMGNIIMRLSSAGNANYDVAKKGSQHKDRFSSLAMGVWYVAKREEVLKKRYMNRQNNTVIGVVTNMRTFKRGR